MKMRLDVFYEDVELAMNQKLYPVIIADFNVEKRYNTRKSMR